LDISERNTKVADGGGNDRWCQGGLSKAADPKDRLVGEAHCQQKVSKKNCCEEWEAHSWSNGRGFETAPFSGAAREGGEVTHRSGGHRSSCCRANCGDHADNIRRAVRRSIDARV
jgi:hypothetical protein